MDYPQLKPGFHDVSVALLVRATLLLSLYASFKDYCLPLLPLPLPRCLGDEICCRCTSGIHSLAPEAVAGRGVFADAALLPESPEARRY